jgi:anti-sigma factor RsiW
MRLYPTREMSLAMISEDELHGFVDGALDDAAHSRVIDHLAHNPEAAARAESYRRQNIGICLLYGATPLPRLSDRALALDSERRRAALEAARLRRRLWLSCTLLATMLAASWGLWLYR